MGARHRRRADRVKRGEIWLADLDPARPTEAAKTRPVILVSNDRANDAAARLGWGVVTVVPVTSNTDKIYPFQMWIASGDGGLQHDSKAQCEQVRSIAVTRLARKLGTLDDHLMEVLDQTLRLHLGL